MFYLDLFATLHSNQVEYVLIGGLAVALHGIERNTMDIDVCIVISPDNLRRMIEAAKELNLSPVLPVPLETLSQIDTLRQWHQQRNLQAFALHTPDLAGVTLDLLLFPPVAPADMCQRAVRLDVSGITIQLASVDDLIALKQSVGRPIDLADIEHLKRLQCP